ncbi:MAG: T9SS type A sorting domain-containing protein, partial [Ignavibacterium sp.]
DGILIAHPPIEYQSYTTDGNGGFIIGGVINNFTIVAQQVSKFGQLGEIITEIKDEAKNNIPTETTLYQNFPNPFNPITTIEYDLPASLSPSKGGTLVKLIVYDILGRRVKVLVDEVQQAGKYEIQFNASTLASGVYFFQLIADQFISSKKMIFLK